MSPTVRMDVRPVVARIRLPDDCLEYLVDRDQDGLFVQICIYDESRRGERVIIFDDRPSTIAHARSLYQFRRSRPDYVPMPAELLRVVNQPALVTIRRFADTESGQPDEYLELCSVPSRRRPEGLLKITAVNTPRYRVQQSGHWCVTLPGANPTQRILALTSNDHRLVVERIRRDGTRKRVPIIVGAPPDRKQRRSLRRHPAHAPRRRTR